MIRSAADKERYANEMLNYDRPRENGNGRRRKDPKAPKKARSSYAFFMTSIRPLIAQQHPTAKFGDIGRMAGIRWNEMTPEERRPFEELAEADKGRNMLEMDQYHKHRQEMLATAAAAHALSGVM